MRSALLAFAVLLSVSSNAQLDSLLGVLNKLPKDTSRLPVLTQLLRNTVFSRPDSALVFAAEYRTIATKSKIPLEIGKGHNYTGMCYSVKSEQENALEHYILALKHFENDTDPWYTAMGHNNIASVLKEEDRNAEAELEFRKALDGFTAIPDSGWVANVTNNLANLLHEEGKLDSAAYYYKNASELLAKLGLFGFAATVRMNLGSTYYDLGKKELALTTMRTALAMHPQDEDALNKASIIIGLGKMQSVNGIADSALINFRTGIRIAKDNGGLQVVADGEGYLSDHFERYGNMDSALVHYKQSVAIRDSIFNTERSEQIADMREKYESGKKDAELLESRTQLDRRAFIIKAIAVGAGLLLLAGIFAYRAYRIKKRSSDELKEKNRTIDAQLKEKELLLREIHHRVKNNLQTVSSLLSLQSRSITDDTARAAVQDGRLRVKSMALIHQDLYREGDLTGVDMKEYIEKLATSLIASYDRSEHVELISDVPPISLDVDTAVPVGLILNELITNALKYAWPDQRNGQLRITLKEENDVLALHVEDNGDGYDPGATRSEESTGFGLGMVKTFATKLKADWNIVNNNGTVVHVIIKKYKLAM